MNVRKLKILRRKSLLGKVLRLPFQLIPEKSIIPIISGKLFGKKWIKGAHNLSVLLGTYERLQSREFYENARAIKVFWDLGAHVGYYSLLFRSGNSSGEIFAFEPLEQNAALFRKHMELNGVRQYTQYTLAVSNECGNLSFSKGNTTVAGRLSRLGEEAVSVIRLSEWVLEKKIKVPQLIKMDIEGEEFKVLKDLQSILKEYKPKIFLSTHGTDVHNACITLLKELDYSLKPLDSLDVVRCREVFAY